MAEKKAEPQVPAVKENTAVVSWQDQLKALAVHTAETEKPSGNWMSFKGGVMTLNGVPMKDNKVAAVVVHSIHENQLYRGKFDPNNPDTPICFAFAEDEDDLAPHPDSPEPQSPTCAECPKNAWGSDPDGGKGKACKNVRRLTLMSETDLGNIPKADVALAKIPVTSVGNWGTYASQIANVLHLPPLAVVTEVSVTPSQKNMFEVNFGLLRKIEDPEQIQALLNKRKDVHPVIFAPYSKSAPPAPKEAAAAGAPKKY